MTFADNVILLFPAFLIGLAFGSLVAFALAGSSIPARFPRIVAGVAMGSAAGVLLFLATQQWWPPIVGPFILCPAGALAAAFLAIRVVRS